MSEEKTYRIESMETSGPVVEDLSLTAAVDKLNNEKANNRFIFIDGKPIQSDIIGEDDVKACKKNISIVNMLIGG